MARDFNRDRLRGRYMSALQGESGATEAYGSFDPRKAATESAQAQFAGFSEELGKQIENLRGRQVGSGRLQTGFGYEDQDRLYSEAYEDMMRGVAQRGVQTAGMRQDQLARRSGRYLDLLSGGMDRAARAEAREAKQAGNIGGGLGALAGGLAGTFLLPGVGTKAGAMMGGAVGKGAGEYLS